MRATPTTYNDPLRVYKRCREIGRDYVAITDHDTIDGTLDLLSRRPDLEPTVIIGEEVETCFLRPSHPSGRARI